ncbi:hypothetical protein AVEN_15100-1 [Araneus ventricosus]|uniref:Uncharacterized protein n=1 Tax=Araneus ventricosus TaxID=182803 RepID=A0A4Y2GEQ5_ARAVE|nr:hypothetical protein AVEN_15100-1 [Araneus ventricosus]
MTKNDRHSGDVQVRNHLFPFTDPPKAHFTALMEIRDACCRTGDDGVYLEKSTKAMNRNDEIRFSGDQCFFLLDVDVKLWKNSFGKGNGNDKKR